MKDAATDHLVRELVAATGETITEAVGRSVAERLERIRGQARGSDIQTVVAAIARRCAALPVLDNRTEEEILGYDHQGIPS
ncbi:MAG: type II toxin-antitoxin system VapB family antitoxin [Acidimicrobiales bacterium]